MQQRSSPTRLYSPTSARREGRHTWVRGLAAALALVCAAVAVPSLGAESRIELRDGSVLSGELIGVKDGAYRLRTPALGEVEIDAADVLSIRPQRPQDIGLADPGTGADSGPAIADIQMRVLKDPEMLNAVKALEEDPDLQAALADPGFMAMVLSGDMQRLARDPRVRRLMADPEVQAIIDALTSR